MIGYVHLHKSNTIGHKFNEGSIIRMTKPNNEFEKAFDQMWGEYFESPMRQRCPMCNGKLEVDVESGKEIIWCLDCDFEGEF